jgi:hypothetical protein
LIDYLGLHNFVSPPTVIAEIGNNLQVVQLKLGATEYTALGIWFILHIAVALGFLMTSKRALTSLSH